jgi:hypothetical protein
VVRTIRRSLPWLAAALALTVSCTDTVYRDRDSFPAPPSGAGGFLGFSDETEKQSVCGNCHVGHQVDWEKTAHSDAWETLQASGHAAAVCEGCHTVNELGNPTDAPGGYSTTKDERYHDVQCESCHGPGLEHVQNPEDPSNVPLASLAVGPDLTNGCGECHNGTHHPYVEEWKNSGHATLALSGNATATRAECQGCHRGQPALRAMGVDARYIERDATAPADLLPITCGVCHDPHGKDAAADEPKDDDAPGKDVLIAGQLRMSAGVPDEERNLCINCHHKRAQPDIDPTTQFSRGPHSPEGPLLLGENVGFWFGDISGDIGKIVGTHGSEANPRLCATCHMVKYQVTDESGNFQIAVVGHTFQATPCADPVTNLPLPHDPGQPDCAKTAAARSYLGCLGSGCHGTEQVAATLDVTVRARIDNLANQVESQESKVPASEFSSTDNRWSVAEGARFNRQLAELSGSHVHNPFLIEALLLRTIQEMQTRYGVSPSMSPAELQPTLTLKGKK